MYFSLYSIIFVINETKLHFRTRNIITEQEPWANIDGFLQLKLFERILTLVKEREIM